MNHPALVTMQIAFRTLDDLEQIAERIREAIRNVVGREALEDFRWRSLPLEPGGPNR